MCLLDYCHWLARFAFLYNQGPPTVVFPEHFPSQYFINLFKNTSSCVRFSRPSTLFKPGLLFAFCYEMNSISSKPTCWHFDPQFGDGIWK